MCPLEVWAVAHRGFFSVRGGTDFVGQPRFIGEDDLEYQSDARRILVRQARLFDLDDSDRWQRYLDPRPVWINVSFLVDDAGVAVFSLERSASSLEESDGRPNAINISGPPEWQVVVV